MQIARKSNKLGAWSSRSGSNLTSKSTNGTFRRTLISAKIMIGNGLLARAGRFPSTSSASNLREKYFRFRLRLNKHWWRAWRHSGASASSTASREFSSVAKNVKIHKARAGAPLSPKILVCGALPSSFSFQFAKNYFFFFSLALRADEKFTTKLYAGAFTSPTKNFSRFVCLGIEETSSDSHDISKRQSSSSRASSVGCKRHGTIRWAIAAGLGWLPLERAHDIAQRSSAWARVQMRWIIPT